MPQVTGAGILQATSEAIEVATAYRTERASFPILSNSNFNRNSSGDQFGLGAALSGAFTSTRAPVPVWAFGYKSPGTAPSIVGTEIRSSNNQTQFGIDNRNVQILNHPVNTLRLRVDAADVYADLGLVGPDLSNTLAAISSIWDAHYFKDGVNRQGQTSGSGTGRFGLVIDIDPDGLPAGQPFDFIDGDAACWIEVIYLQVGTDATVGTDSAGELYLTGLTSSFDPDRALTPGGMIFRQAEGTRLSISTGAAGDELVMANSVVGGSPLSDEATDWPVVRDTLGRMGIMSLSGFSGQFSLMAGRVIFDRPNGYSAWPWHGASGNSIQQLRVAIERMAPEAFGQVLYWDAVGQFRGSNANATNANVCFMINEIFNSAGLAGSGQVSINTVDNVNTPNGYKAELDALHTYITTAVARAVQLLASSHPGKVLRWTICLLNEHRTTKTGNNRPTEEALIAAAGEWAESRNQVITANDRGVIALDPDAMPTDLDVYPFGGTFTTYYDDPAEFHLGVAVDIADSAALITEKELVSARGYTIKFADAFTAMEGASAPATAPVITAVADVSQIEYTFTSDKRLTAITATRSDGGAALTLANFTEAGAGPYTYTVTLNVSDANNAVSITDATAADGSTLSGPVEARVRLSAVRMRVPRQ